MQGVSTALELPIPLSESAHESRLEQAEVAYEELVAWLVSKIALQTPLHEVEAEHARRGREVLRLLLEAHIRARGTGQVGPAILVTAEDREDKFYEEGRENIRYLKSVFGPVEVVRQAYSSPGESSIHPLEQALPIPRRSFSYEFQRRMVSEVVRGPVDEARDCLEEVTGVKVGKGSAETIITEAATDFDAFYEQRQNPSTEETGPILVVEADGKGIPMVKPVGTTTPAHRKKGEKSNKKRMATLAAVYTTQPRVRTPEEVTESLFRDRRKLEPVGEGKEKKKRVRPEGKRVWASLKKGKDGVLEEAAAECERRDPERQKKRVALTDGERALQKRALDWLVGFLLILDIMHAIPRLWKVAHVFHKEGSEEALEWVKERTLRILQGKVVDVVRGIRICATKRGLRGSKRETIDQATRYLYKNRHYMRYNEYLAQGLPIATGHAEGAARNLVKDRMERSGMRWGEDGAEAMLQLRALYLSGDLEEYWVFHIGQEQARLHPPDLWRPLEVVAEN